MTRARRVTLRCACQDFDQDWHEPSDLTNIRALREVVGRALNRLANDSDVASALRRVPPVNRLRHPLILAFDDQFAGDDDEGTLRESISAVSDRKWWKQTYSSRWRGAATIVRADFDETVWLGAAGYHREGSPEDFYDWFANECADGSSNFLPSAEDDKLEGVGQKIRARDAWMAQLHLTAQVLLANAVDAGSAGPVEVRDPSGAQVVLRLTVMFEEVEDSGDTAREAFVEIVPTSWENTRHSSVATRTILSAIEPDAERWRTAPLEGPAVSHSSLLSDDAILRAQRARERGSFDIEETPGVVRLGTMAHYAQISQLTDATVMGEPVRAICGYWFVPMHDHDEREVCPSCSDAHKQLPG